MRGKHDARAEAGQLFKDPVPAFAVIHHVEEILNQQVVAQAFKLHKGGIFHTVEQNNLTFNVLDNPEHQINFFGLTFDACKTAKERIKNLLRVLAGLKSFAA